MAMAFLRSLQLSFPPEQEALYLQHTRAKSRLTSGAFLLSFYLPFWVAEGFFIKDHADTLTHFSIGLLAGNLLLCAFACMLMLIASCKSKVSLEVGWAALLCGHWILLAFREKDPHQNISTGALAEMLVSTSFCYLPLRFSTAFTVFVVAVISISAAGAIKIGSASRLDVLVLVIVGAALLRQLALLETKERRDFVEKMQPEATPSNQKKSEVGSSPLLAFQGVAPQEQNRPSSKVQSERSKVRQKTAPQSQLREDLEQLRMLAENHHTLTRRRSEGCIFGTENKVSRFDSLKEASRGSSGVRSRGSSDFREGKSPKRRPISPAQVPLPHSVSVSECNYSVALSLSPPVLSNSWSSDLCLPPRMASRRSKHGAPSLSYSHSSDSVDSLRAPQITVQASCQTDIIWKDTAWHCTRCSKPPKLQEEKRPITAKSRLSAAMQDALQLMGRLQGTWNLVYGPENVSPWLQHFSICGAEVTCEDSAKTLELLESVQVSLCGGTLLLDNDDYLHRHGKSGQHLMFERAGSSENLQDRSLTSLDSDATCGRGESTEVPVGLLTDKDHDR
mmetsp:Transcript_1308/g.3059  ORF Transcript_1308/g.3059 Transcript_1308/m.3059 type:complete len:562 (-) Transcript_1308:99-1784(-)